MTAEDPLVQIAKDTAANTAILKEVHRIVRKNDETLHVDCGIDGNGKTGLVDIAKDSHGFVRSFRGVVSGARKAALYGALSAAAVAVLGVAARGFWILGIWLLGG